MFNKRKISQKIKFKKLINKSKILKINNKNLYFNYKIFNKHIIEKKKIIKNYYRKIYNKNQNFKME